MNIGLGEKIKELRAAKNLTQAKLAERLGVTTSAVSSYEVGERQPSYDVLIKMARIFRVTADYLLGVNNKDLLIIDVTELNNHQRYLVREIINQFKLTLDYPTTVSEWQDAVPDELLVQQAEEYERNEEMLQKEIEELNKNNDKN